MDALEILQRTIQFDLKHEHYDKTLEIKKFCHQVMDVDSANQAEILMRWRDKQTKKQHETMLRLYNSLTTYALNPVENLYKRVHRVDPSLDVVEHEDEEKERTIKRSLETYHAGSGIKRYLNDSLLHYNLYDPNAFIITERKDERGMENEVKKIIPYPLEVSSEQAINYHYENGSPIWLIVEQKRIESFYKTTGKKVELDQKEVSDFYFYAAGIQIALREYINDIPEEADKLISITPENGEERKFALSTYNPGNTEFPGHKAGALKHPDAANVKVPLYWNAKPVLIDLINHKATLDVSINKHIYPKKFAYVTRCEYENTKTTQRCIEGYLDGDTNHKCPVCNGSGSSIHYGEQDLIEFKLPSDYAEWSSLPKLSDLSHYEVVPIEVTRYIGELVKEGPMKVQYALFNTSTEEKPLVSTTATEEMHNWEAVNVAVGPYAQCWAVFYELTYRVTAQYHDYQDGFMVDYEFPKDLKLETLNSLIARFQAAKQAGLSYDTIWQIQLDITQKMFSNSVEKIEEIKIKESIKPFRGIADEMIGMILQGRANDDPDRVFYENFAKVIDVAEVLAGMPLYQIAPEKRMDFVNQAIALVIEEIKYTNTSMPASPLDIILEPDLLV